MDMAATDTPSAAMRDEALSVEVSAPSMTQVPPRDVDPPAVRADHASASDVSLFAYGDEQGGAHQTEHASDSDALKLTSSGPTPEVSLAAEPSQEDREQRSAPQASPLVVAQPPPQEQDQERVEDKQQAAVEEDPQQEHEEENQQQQQQQEPPPNAEGATLDAIDANAVVATVELVVAPPMKQVEFRSWSDFHAYTSKYGEETFQLYRVASATPTATRNTRLSAPRAKYFFIPVAEFEHYAKTLRCVHGGKPRSRSLGKRQRQNVRPMGCPARINACVQKVKGRWQVYVTAHWPEHNHELSAERFHGYPGVRNALAPNVERAVALLHGRNTPRRVIWQYIRDTTDSHISMKDVHNLVARIDREADELLASVAKVTTSRAENTATVAMAPAPASASASASASAMPAHPMPMSEGNGLGHGIGLSHGLGYGQVHGHAHGQGQGQGLGLGQGQSPGQSLGPVPGYDDGNGSGGGGGHGDREMEREAAAFGLPIGAAQYARFTRPPSMYNGTV